MKWKRAVGFGFCSWLVPFLASVAIYPLKKANGPLFESIMPVVLAVSTMALFVLYARRRGHVPAAEAAVVGLMWMSMNIVFDLCLFLEGPMKMTVPGYFSDIGVAYLSLPVMTVGSACVGAV